MTDGQTNSLRRKLIDAQLIAALAAVVDWLRAEAEERRLLAKDAADRRDDGDPNGERHRERFTIKYETIRGLADAIDKELGK